jgi:hypothetical protein
MYINEANISLRPSATLNDWYNLYALKSINKPQGNITNKLYKLAKGGSIVKGYILIKININEYKIV